MKPYLKSQASLAVVIAVATISVSMSALVANISYNHYANLSDATNATKSLLLADSALENALYRLQLDAGYTGETFAVPEGSVTIAVTTGSATTRNIVVTTTGLPVRRQLNASINITGLSNPDALPAVFGSEDVSLVKSSAMLVGNLWSNDNVSIDEDSIVQGDVWTAGQGNLTSSYVRNAGRVEDNPNTVETEGNVYSIDRIRINNNGYVQNAAISRTGVTITSGGYAGSTQVNSSLVIPTQQIPTFKYNELKAIAQSAGTYYTSPSQFLNFLTLNGNTTSGGVYYIESTSDLTFASGTTYNLAGSIISHGNINIYSTTFNLTRDSNYPVMVSRRSISFLDQNNCNCVANVTGIMFAEFDIRLKHDQYNGPGTYAVTVNGGLYAGDQVSIEDHTRVIVNSDYVYNVIGFNISPGVPPPSTDNLVRVTSWQIE